MCRNGPQPHDHGCSCRRHPLRSNVVCGASPQRPHRGYIVAGAAPPVASAASAVSAYASSRRGSDGRPLPLPPSAVYSFTSMRPGGSSGGGDHASTAATAAADDADDDVAAAAGCSRVSTEAEAPADEEPREAPKSLTARAVAPPPAAAGTVAKAAAGGGGALPPSDADGNDDNDDDGSADAADAARTGAGGAAVAAVNGGGLSRKAQWRSRRLRAGASASAV